MFDGRTLNELWLFTDDSQQNPAVIVTPHLPEDFPVNAPLINQVSVTGCFYKLYVYNSQDSRRVAPLILAGTIDWQPTDSEILSLADAGHLSSGSPMALRADSQRSDSPGQGLLLLVCFGAFLTIMILWGKSHRERQDRRNLIERIGGPPQFESMFDGRYSSGNSTLSDYTSRYDV